jgi:NAD(P)-dependent dehydrogenase (short-subunit alcohol dehydrogenase family)
MPYEAWQKVIQTNLTGTFFLVFQAAGRHRMVPKSRERV